MVSLIRRAKLWCKQSSLLLGLLTMVSLIRRAEAMVQTIQSLTWIIEILYNNVIVITNHYKSV